MRRLPVISSIKKIITNIVINDESVYLKQLTTIMLLGVERESADQLANLLIAYYDNRLQVTCQLDMLLLF